jgi:hypothetical protein
MNPRRLVFAAALAFAAVEGSAAVAPLDLPETAIERCRMKVQGIAVAEERSVTHPFDLGEHCPELATALAASLHETGAAMVALDATSIEGLQDLSAFAAGVQAAPKAAERFYLDLNRVDALLAEVLVEENAEESLWDRFLRWLEQYAKDGESPRLGGFFDWLEGLDAPPWLADVVIKVSIVLIVLLALIVIGNELRLSGLFRRGRYARAQSAPQRTQHVPAAARTPALDELPGLPPRELAAGILAIVTATLAERGWLSSSESLTNGELVRQVAERRSVLAASFTSLVLAIEKILYGDRPPDDATRQRLVAAATALVEHARSGSAAASTRPR